MTSKKFFNYHFYPRFSKIITDKRFVNTDNGQLGGTHWTSFYKKDKRSFYFDSVGGQPGRFLLQQSPKLKIYHNSETRYMNPRLCGTVCLYFFITIERMNFYDGFSKCIFVKQMPINLFGSISGNTEKKSMHTFLYKNNTYELIFPNLTLKKIDMKNHFRIKYWKNPINH